MLSINNISGFNARAAKVPVGVPGSWKLVFFDEFNGSTINLSKWRPNWLAGNDTAITPPPEGTAGDAAMDPAQVTVSGGNCVLTTVASPVTVNSHTYPNRSGLIETDGRFNFTYGCCEARIWIDASSGTAIANWPAFWTNGQPTWPTNGEDDIVEGLGGVAKSNYHYGTPGTPLQSGTSAYSGDCTGWHVWSANWQPGVIKYYLDGVLARTISSNILSAAHFIILNLSVGGSGGVDKIPGEMKIDYVRVYQ